MINLDRSISVQLRGAPVGQLRAWLRKTAGLEPDSDLRVPVATVKTTVQGGVFTCYVGITEKGLKVLAVRAKTRGTGQAWPSIGSEPTRSPTTPGNSVVFGRPLGIGEYEQDVTLTGDEDSWIQFEMDVETYQKPVFICEVAGDANVEPEILNYSVDGTTVTFWVDDDALSVRLLKTAGAGSAYDQKHNTTAGVVVIDLSADIPPGGIWTMNGYARNALAADPDDLVSPPTEITVENDGEPWLITTPTAPADGSNEITFVDTAASDDPLGYRLHVYSTRHTYPLAGGAGTFYPETDITSSLAPSPLASELSVTPVTYTWGTPFVREDGSPTHIVFYSFRTEIVKLSVTPNVVVYDSSFPIPYPYDLSYGFIE